MNTPKNPGKIPFSGAIVAFSTAMLFLALRMSGPLTDPIAAVAVGICFLAAALLTAWGGILTLTRHRNPSPPTSTAPHHG